MFSELKNESDIIDIHFSLRCYVKSFRLGNVIIDVNELINELNPYPCK